MVPTFNSALVLSLVLLFFESSSPAEAAPVIARHQHLKGRDSTTWASTKTVAVGLTELLGLPTAEEIKEKIGLKAAWGNTQVFNIPGYAYWTGSEWNLRMHGTAYVPLPLTDPRVDQIGQWLMPGYPRSTWTPEITKNVRNMTESLFCDPKDGLNLSFDIMKDGWLIRNFTLEDKTDQLGEYDTWVTVDSESLIRGDSAQQIQTLDEYSTLSPIGNATAYLVPEEGITFVSDVDDVLRETLVWEPSAELVNSIGLDYKPWMNMPEVVDGISKANPNAHWHYVTTTPQPGARKYVEFTLNYYPPGSFDFRPMNLTTPGQLFSTRKQNIERLVQSFPKRRFVLIGDVSNSDVVNGYASIASAYPDQIQCILMRNDTATDDTMWMPYNLKGYAALPDTKYQFYRTPDDLVGIDFANGGCRNYTFPQNVTFGEQLPSLHTVGQAMTNPASPLAGFRDFFNSLSDL